MSYNLKCCSFYPNNFDASALALAYSLLFIIVFTCFYVFSFILCSS